MKCYGQIIYESGSYACPYPDQYDIWDSIAEAKRALAATWNDIDVDPTDPSQGVSLLLWMGEPDPEALFPCDGANFMHDRVYILGPRYGVQRIE